MELYDFFGRVKIQPPKKMLQCKRCIFTVLSPGYETLLDDMMLSVLAKGKVPDALFVAFVVNPNAECLAVVQKYNGFPILCYTDGTTNIDTKSIVYNITDFVDCDKYLYLDTDVMVLQSLEPLFDILDSIPENSICMTQDQYFAWASDLEEAYTGTLYNGDSNHFNDLMDADDVDRAKLYPNVVNAGIFVTRKSGLIELLKTIKSFSNLLSWAREGFIREQFIVNLALAKMNNLCVLNMRYNWQLALRTVFRYEFDENNFDLFTGYNPFFLDHIKEPVRILHRLADKSDIMSVKLRNEIDNPKHNYILDNLNKLSLTRLEYLQAVEEIFSLLIIQLELFDNKFLSKLGYNDLDIDFVPANYHRVRFNKEIISRHYIDESDRRNEHYINESIAILHFNGPYKNYGCTRTYIKDHMIANKRCNKVVSDIKIGISTHKKYQTLTLPSLLHGLTQVNGIPAENILVVSGGWEESDSYTKDGILYHNVTHNSFDHNAIIDVTENKNKNNFWFFMQDTCNVGPNFFKALSECNKDYDYTTVDGQGYLNMGLFSWDFIEHNTRYIMLLKNCNKERAMLSEKIFLGLGKTTSFGDKYPTFVGYSDVYKTGTLRNICYYPSIDFYKYQANMSDAMRICTP